MKNLFCISACLLFLFARKATAQGTGQIERVRSEKIEFAVSGNSRLIVDNTFGDIHISTWNKDQVSIQINIQGKDNDAAIAQRIVDSVQIVRETDAQAAFIKSRPNRNRNGDNIKIDYVVQIPATINLVIKNQTGNVFVDGDLKGDAAIDIFSGVLQAQEIAGSNNIIKITNFPNTIDWGKSSIKSIHNGRLAILGNIDIGSADNLKLSGCDTLIIRSVKHLDIRQGRGIVHIDSVHDITGEIQDSRIRVNYLVNKADVQFSNCPSVEINGVNTEFIQMNIACDSSNLKITFNRKISMYSILEMRASQLDCDFIQDLKLIPSNLDQYRGKTGAGRSYFFCKAARGSNVKLKLR